MLSTFSELVGVYGCTYFCVPMQPFNIFFGMMMEMWQAVYCPLMCVSICS